MTTEIWDHTHTTDGKSAVNLNALAIHPLHKLAVDLCLKVIQPTAMPSDQRRPFGNSRIAELLPPWLSSSNDLNDWDKAQRLNALNMLSSEQHDGTSGTVGTGFVFEIGMELLHRCSGLKQPMIAGRFGVWMMVW
jgi:hypothetical protein